jgi:hypothetical protein
VKGAPHRSALGSSSGAKVAAVHQTTEGNPLFVRETVRLLAAQATLERPGRLGVPIPGSVRAVIQRRLRRCPVMPSRCCRPRRCWAGIDLALGRTARRPAGRACARCAVGGGGHGRRGRGAGHRRGAIASRIPSCERCSTNGCRSRSDCSCTGGLARGDGARVWHRLGGACRRAGPPLRSRPQPSGEGAKALAYARRAWRASQWHARLRGGAAEHRRARLRWPDDPLRCEPAAPRRAHARAGNYRKRRRAACRRRS